MGSNYIAQDATITPSFRCVNDSTVGYAADFSANGEVDEWEYYDGIHTYGAWGGFLFGTLYGEYGTIGRYNVFKALDASTHYFVRIVMKYNPWPRDERGNHPLPTQGKIRWRTIQSANWTENKEAHFDIEADNDWHTYILNVGVEQFWAGDVYDLRIWPVVENGADGDEFFIRAIDIFSTESHQCRNLNCEKYPEYSFPCPWIGLRASQESGEHAPDANFNIDNLSELIININDWGNETVKVKEVLNGSGREVSNNLAKAISRTNIGGYSEVQVEYTDNNTFKIYSGVAHATSSIEIIDNDLSRYLKFFASEGSDISTKLSGETPVNGYVPLSSFQIKTHQALGLLDNNERSALTFNPFQYSIEGGRRDWQESSIGLVSIAVGNNDGDTTLNPQRKYFMIENYDRLMVDYNHPFNASGRIKKIWVQCSLDMPYYVTSKHESSSKPSEYPFTRKGSELPSGKILIVRPKRNGSMEVIYRWGGLNDRDPNRTYNDALYSVTQEGLDLDVDVFVNKGDMIAIYGMNIYVGKSISGEEYDAQFYQISLNPQVGDTFFPGRLYGDGSAGLLVYAHGTDPQRRLYLDIDLGYRYNIDKIDVKGEALNSILEYNIARCLDIDWQADMLDGWHWTYHIAPRPQPYYWYQRYNVYYGLNRLNDGIYNVPDGLACDSYYLTNDLSSGAQYTYNAGPGVVPTNPYYFWSNGDEEWLAIWLHAQTGIHSNQAQFDFSYDPFTIFLHFPHNTEKKIYKSKIYFKEKFNFRSFALSTYGGFYYDQGDADDPKYNLIPDYTKIILDNVEFHEDSPTYNMVADYLFKNPCTGHMIKSATSPLIYEWDPVLSDVVEDFSGTAQYMQESGYYTYQRFTVDNSDAWQTARRVDWQIIEHQWEPVACKGFRIYTDFHKSTKITEIELYGVAEDIGSSLAGSVVMTFSDYGEEWWPTESVQNTEDKVEIHIGDSPRYFTLEIVPVTETRYDDVVIYVKTEDVYAGAKGCEYIYNAEEAKIGVENAGQAITVKNNYHAPYDLYVDISAGNLTDDGLIYYSSLSDLQSIANPVIGPDSRYYKLTDYPLLNQDYNCAINCHTFGLKNLIDGATAYYSYNDMFNWDRWGTLSNGSSINFYNLPESSRTTVFLPSLSRSRYWKFGLSDPDLSMNVREMRAYDLDGNLLDPIYYHDLNKTFIEAPASERAPHLENTSVVGSYYTLTGDQYITMDLGAQVSLDRIELYHDGIADYVNFVPDEDPIVGIDKYTRMCLRAWKDNTGTFLQDVSYYEHNVTMHGSTYIDTLANNVSLHEDLGCLTNLAEWKKSTNTLTGYNSVFNGVSASGTVTSGICEYPGYVDFDLYCSNRSRDRFWLDLREDSGTQAYKVWQHLPFEITFKVNISSATSGDDGSFCVGMLAEKQNYRYLGNPPPPCYLEFWAGAQMVFDPLSGRFGLAIRQNQPLSEKGVVNQSTAYRTYTSTTGLNYNTDYYCKLTCYGAVAHRDTDNVLYRAEVWTDAIDGSNRIVNLTRNTKLFWEAYRFAVASCCFSPGDDVKNDCAQNPPETPTRIQGRVTDLQLNIDTDINTYPWKDPDISENEKASIRIPAGSSNYVSIDNSNELDVRWRRHTHDFWVKFNDLPAVGQRYTLMEQYNYGGPSSGRGWRLALYNIGPNPDWKLNGWYRFEWWINKGDPSYEWKLIEHNGMNQYEIFINNFNIVKDKWYFLVFATGEQVNVEEGFTRESFFDISGRAIYNNSTVGNARIMYPMPPGADIIIGKDFDGWICEPRISRAYNDGGTDNGGHRYSTSVTPGPWNSPVKPYTRMYPFSFYVSDNNEFFGHYADVDAFKQVDDITYLPYLYYFGDNEFAEQYNSYFAIDLGHRYDIDIVRRYGSSNDHLIDREANVIYSNIDTDDPFEAFMTEPSFDPEDDFYGEGGELLDKERWYLGSSVVGNEARYLSMKNGRLEHRVDSAISNIRFYSTFGIRGDFEIEVTVGKISAPNTFNWWTIFRVDFSDEVKSSYNSSSSETNVNTRMEYRSDTESPYYRAKTILTDGGTSYSAHYPLSDNEIKLKIIREGFHFFTKYYDDGAWRELDDRPIHDAKGKDVYRIHFGLQCDTGYPTTKVYWKDFKINHADRLVMRSHHWDARWMAIEMLNGDSASRNLKKLGMYPDITDPVCPDDYNYNSSWIDLGPSVTGYSTGDNVALGATVSGSSFKGEYVPENVTDGVIDNTRAHAWLSDNTSEQWLSLDLGEEKQIYRVKLYHGYSTDDNEFIAEDYRIESSLDGQSFTTRWTITSNSSFTRTHDKADPFTARFIRMYITDYKADNVMHIKELDGINYYEWHGACMREIEVYEYYGYDYVNSEEWPIVSINLRDQFYIQAHTLVGLYAENTDMDWSNSDSYFAWSDSVLQDPKKVAFSPFGTAANYEQWVVIKRDTATYHNVDPYPASSSNAYGVDYLKHAIIHSTTKENPVDYPWWWSSILSTLSRDYTQPVEISISSLRIDYPASTALDTVQFIEGSNWGVDSDIAFRDGLGFRWYIEDVDKLDTTEGYVFFGGQDGTNSPQPVEYRWYLSTLSGTAALQTGWNRPFLRLKDADEVIYNENADPFSIIRPEIPEYTQLKTWGFKFKGKGEAFGMNIDGGLIQRNHFADSSKFDYGLYLVASDYLECPLGELDLKSGTIEFWMRPDYTFYGLDIHRRFRNRSLFHFSNVANDVFGFMINSEGFTIYYGNLATDLRALVIKGIIAGAIDELFHIAVAFSANGANIDSDGSTLKLYLNNGLLGSNYDPWRYTDEKLFKFTMGGKVPLGLIEHSSSLTTTSVDSVISNLRIYNYCKSDFTDSMGNYFTDDSVDLVPPSKMIEISQDNVTYYKVGDAELPFFYEQVPAGDSKEIYVRSVIPVGLTGKENRTAGITTIWDIGV